MSADVLEVTIPLPPSVNHSHELHVARSRRTGKLYRRPAPSKELRAWRDDAWMEIAKAKTRAGWIRVLPGRQVVVELAYFWPDARRRDTHNRIKAIMDVLEVAGVFADDRQALAVETGCAIDRDRPRVELRIREREQLFPSAGRAER